MIAVHPKATAKAQFITIQLAEDERPMQVATNYEVHCGRRTFNEGVTWHDGRGVSVVRGEAAWFKMLELVVQRIVEDTRERIKP